MSKKKNFILILFLFLMFNVYSQFYNNCSIYLWDEMYEEYYTPDNNFCQVQIKVLDGADRYAITITDVNAEDYIIKVDGVIKESIDLLNGEKGYMKWNVVAAKINGEILRTPSPLYTNTSLSSFVNSFTGAVLHTLYWGEVKVVLNSFSHNSQVQ